jgi:hypothetical protein
MAPSTLPQYGESNQRSHEPDRATLVHPREMTSKTFLGDTSRYDQQFGTFAPSKNDIIGALRAFLGEPTDPHKLENYAEHHAATCTFLTHHLSTRPNSREVTPSALYRPVSRCLSRNQRQAARHAQQPPTREPRGLADHRWPAIQADRWRRSRVGWRAEGEAWLRSHRRNGQGTHVTLQRQA